MLHAPSTADDVAALRAEHDALAARLEVRASIDLVKRGAIVGFVAFIALGMTLKLAWDRWAPDAWWPPGVLRPPPHPGAPLFFLVALAVTAALAVASARIVLRARRLMREEDALFARFRALRDALGMDR